MSQDTFLDIFSAFLEHEVTVEVFEGDGAFGVSYGAAESVTGVMVEHINRLIRTATGDNVQSNTRIYIPTDTIDKFPLESRVTINNRHYTVAQLDSFAVYGLPDHAVVYLI